MKVSRIVVQAKWFLGIFSFCPDYADNEENDRFFSARQVQLSQQLDFIGDKGNEEREREREKSELGMHSRNFGTNASNCLTFGTGT